MYWFNNTVNIRARNSGLYNITSSPVGYLQILFYSTCGYRSAVQPFGVKLPASHLGFVYVQSAGLLNPEHQSNLPLLASLLCAFRRGCCFRKLDSPGVNFHSSALEISGCLPCLVTCHCTLDSLAVELCLDTSTNKLTSKLCVCIWVHSLGKMLDLWQLQFSYMTIIVFIFWRQMRH